MNICLIGAGLSNLILAKKLAKLKIKVDLYNGIVIKKNDETRTIAISENNFKYLKEDFIKLNDLTWKINNIKIFNESREINEILHFSNKENLAYIFKNKQLLNYLNKDIKKNKFIKLSKIFKNEDYISIQKKNYDLIINSENENFFSKNIFSNKIKKNYKSNAYTAIINHEIINNNTAYQVFTKSGPIAFLPLSEKQTSIVYSFYNNFDLKNDRIFKNLINKYNQKYKILKFSKIKRFPLKFCTLRKYYFKNILSFGDSLHIIHPLAGQGLNMTIRDIKILIDLINQKLKLGLPLDEELLKNFETNSKSYNFIFSIGIDFIYEFFKFESKFENNYIKSLFKILNQNKYFKKYSTKIANEGFTVNLL